MISHILTIVGIYIAGFVLGLYVIVPLLKKGREWLSNSTRTKKKP